MGWPPEHLANRDIEDLTRCYRVKFKTLIFQSISRIFQPELDKSCLSFWELSKNAIKMRFRVTHVPSLNWVGHPEPAIFALTNTRTNFPTESNLNGVWPPWTGQFRTNKSLEVSLELDPEVADELRQWDEQRMCQQGDRQQEEQNNRNERKEEEGSGPTDDAPYSDHDGAAAEEEEWDEVLVLPPHLQERSNNKGNDDDKLENKSSDSAAKENNQGDDTVNNDQQQLQLLQQSS
jgi:hypothetical protein